jgi:AraC-like DNA-binding protein
MLCIGALEELTEPGPLGFCIGRKVEYDLDALRQESTNVWPKRITQSGRVLDESRYISDLARKEVIQELVLNKENGILSLGQISRKRGLSRRHFAAQENQLR